MTTNQTQSPTTTDLALSPRQQHLMEIRDDLAPGAKPQAIIPRNFVEAQQLCQALAASSLVPKAYRTATGAVDMLLVVMTGSELGIPPMAALRLFTTWDGVPRLMAEGIRAVMMMSPNIEYFEMATCDDKHATWIGRRRGRPEKSITWTMERAKRAGLTGKENWSKYQEAMLNARASMDLGRILAPDIISGMRSLEEAQDGDFIEAHATERKTEFSAPQAVAVVAVNSSDHRIAAAAPPQAIAPQGPPPGVPVVDAPKPKAAKAPKVVEAKGTSVDDGVGNLANGEQAPTKSVTPPSALDQAVEKTRAADAARAASPTPPSSPTEPSPSIESAAASTAESGASCAGDDSFGEDPVDPPAAPSGNRLADFFAELAKCANQRELGECANKWRAWSRQQSEAGDTSFGKNGENAAKMAKMYATRKGEVPA